MPTSLLLIEDDAAQAELTRAGLEDCGYTVDHAPDGGSGLGMARTGGHDVVIADRMLPDMDGTQLIAELRAAGYRVPVVVLSALGEVNHRIEGLRCGGDDYVVKPFALPELVARIEAVLRRAADRKAKDATHHLKVGDLELDRLRHSAWRAGRPLVLTTHEFRLLDYLMSHAGQVVTRAMLFKGVWNYKFDPRTNVIDVHLSRLRSKIDHPGALPLIQTVRGSGYSLRAPEPA